MKSFITAALIFSGLATQGHAQDAPVCMSTAEMEAALVDWYNETPAQQRDDGSIVWASGIGGSWTLVTYAPDGTSCALAQGDNWSPDLRGDALFAQNGQNNG